MDIGNTLLDNSENLKMVDTLRKCISDKDVNIIRIATGYWDIPGMALLKDVWGTKRKVYLRVVWKVT